MTYGGEALGPALLWCRDAAQFPADGVSTSIVRPTSAKNQPLRAEIRRISAGARLGACRLRLWTGCPNTQRHRELMDESPRTATPVARRHVNAQQAEELVIAVITRHAD